MKKILLAVMMASTLTLAACQDAGNKELLGAGGGAILGGLAGAQFGKGKGQLVGVGVGTLLGALAGSEIGRSLDKADMMYAERAQSQAYQAPIGQTITWNNPDSGNSGTFTPVRDGTSNSGRYCREYSQTIYVDGRQQTGYGTACRAPDGSWELVK